MTDVLGSCPLVLANDSNYLANDSRACAGSGLSITMQPRIAIEITRPVVR